MILMEIQSLENTIAEIAGTARCLWEKGWAERNAGNISVNITGLLSEKEMELFNTGAIQSLPANYSYLSDQFLMVTSAGSRMRDLAEYPHDHLCILKTDASGTTFIQWPEKGRVPTSELPTHLAVHDMLIRTNSPAKALVHTHATELIALTQIGKYCSTEALNRLLWTMHPETILFIPDGLGFIPFELPGTSGIADATIKILEDHPVALWEKHGVLATGTTAADAFDTIDLLAKSARIFFMVKSAGFEPEGLTEEQLIQLMK
jgi:rhamnulose-1-phosphate aldolase